MALTYDYTRVVKMNKFTDEEHNNASRFAWVLMGVDMNNVCEKNVDEIVFRLLFAKQCNQNFLVGDFTKGSLKAFIKTYIGYETNVGYKTRNAYMKKIMRIVENKVKEMGVN
jgi:hypothetical protein